MKRSRTTNIKPATRDALKDQLALAADEIERLRRHNETLNLAMRFFVHVPKRRWWQWWRK